MSVSRWSLKKSLHRNVGRSTREAHFILHWFLVVRKESFRVKDMVELKEHPDEVGLAFEQQLRCKSCSF
jgi:hypothetical protein